VAVAVIQEITQQTLASVEQAVVEMVVMAHLRVFQELREQ
jgi:hypothetical protein